MALVDRFVFSIDDLLGDCEGISCTERLRLSYELVDNAAEGPDISFFGIRLRLHNLGARIENGPHEGLHHTRRLVAPSLRQAKIGQFQVEFGVDEDIARRQVPMHYALLHVKVAESGA